MPGPTRTLSEAASKALLRQYGLPVVEDREVQDADAVAPAAQELGWPVAIKLCGAAIAHKTERGLVRLGLADAGAARSAAAELLAAARPDDGAVTLLVTPMIEGSRELIAGLVRDPQFGLNAMLGVGGILAEAVGDVVFCPVPLSRTDAEDMIDALVSQPLLGPFRGEAEVDRERLVDVLVGLSALAGDRGDIAAIDLNPLIVDQGRPIAVDALVELDA